MEDYFIDFLDDNMLVIKKRYDDLYILYFNFNLPKANTHTEILKNLIESSKFLEKINVGLNRLKNEFNDIDIECSNNISLNSHRDENGEKVFYN